jgi:membrane protein YqaA with SNARE-associated domain
MMNWVLLILLALALSVPVGSAVTVFLGLVLEYVLAWLVEIGQAIEEDPQKRQTAKMVGLIALVVVMLGAVGLLLACGLLIVPLWLGR